MLLTLQNKLQENRIKSTGQKLVATWTVHQQTTTKRSFSD